MSKFQRHLMMGGKLSDEEFIRKHLVCHYSPMKQGATNESLAADPRLVDLSGNGRDMELVNLAFTTSSGIQSDGGLHLWGGYGICNSDIVLKDFTVIAKRKRNLSAYIGPPCLVSKDTTFALDYDLGRNHCLSFGAQSLVGYEAENIAYMTPTVYNGITPIDKGNKEDSVDKKLILGFPYKPEDGWTNHTTIYDVLLFDRTLTEAQIQWVIDNLINN